MGQQSQVEQQVVGNWQVVEQEGKKIIIVKRRETWGQTKKTVDKEGKRKEVEEKETRGHRVDNEITHRLMESD